MKRIIFLLGVLCITFISIFAGCKSNTKNAPVLSIDAIKIFGAPAIPGDTITATVMANNTQGSGLNYSWTTSYDWQISGPNNTPTIIILSPDTFGMVGTATVTVYNSNGLSITGSITFTTYNQGDEDIQNLSILPEPVFTSASLSCSATDPDGDPLSYLWNVGGIYITTGSTAAWESPGIPGYYNVKVIVNDGHEGIAISTASMNISSYSSWPRFNRDLQSTGLSPISTSTNFGAISWSYTTGSWINASPVIGADGTIYIGAMNGTLYAINASGGLKWSYTTGSWINASPAIDGNGTIYVNAMNSNLYALNPSGGLKWSYTTASQNKFLYQFGSSPAIGADGTIYFGASNGVFYALNPTDGTLEWNYDLGINAPIESSPAIGFDGTIYVGSYNGNLYAIRPNGSLKWITKISAPIESSPAIGADGTIYIGADNNTIYAVNPDGSIKWSYKTSDEIISTPAIGNDGTICVGSLDNNLYALNPTDGTLKWIYGLPNSAGSPVISENGIIYIGSVDGNLYAINLNNGILRWGVSSQGPIVAAPAIGTDGTIYVGSYDGNLYALR